MMGYSLLLALIGLCSAQSRLGSYNLDSTVTVSGLSSGAYMANQFHVAHSGKVTGAAIFAGGVAQKLQEFYTGYISSGTIKTVYNVAAEHGMPTDSYGGTCGIMNNDYINNCNYNGAYEALNHLYGGLQKPSSSAGQSGQLILFNQSEFFNLAPPVTYGMDSAGYIYVPSACASGTRCRLHIAFHGCLQGREKVGDKFARYAGYNQVADLNNFIILYPQARTIVTNPNGCWDWWGYTGIYYATKDSFQITGVDRMMRRTQGLY